MINSDNYSVNGDGHLMIEGCDALFLAKKYATPLYVMSENELRRNIRAFKNSISDAFGSAASIAYACKALSCKEILRIMKSEGLRLDVVSAGELHVALAVDYPCEDIFFHGNNKSEYELQLALEANVGRIVVDNLNELRQLDELAVKKGITAKILLRVKPGVDAHTHSYVRTGGVDSKFGLGIEFQELYHAVELTQLCKGIDLVGLHCHIGSQILETEPYYETAKIMVELFCDVNDEYDAGLTEINLGGGFGIPYTETQTAPDTREFVGAISDSVKKHCAKRGVPVPHITLEPGRSIVGSAGITLYIVGSIKNIKEVRTYLAVDGGMADNPRYALYQSDYMALVAGKVGGAKDFIVTIAGKCCESGDILQENIAIQHAVPGDILAVMPTGAYNYSMASNYNQLPRPAMVMVDGNTSRIIVNRESYDDLLHNNI